MDLSSDFNNEKNKDIKGEGEEEGKGEGKLTSAVDFSPSLTFGTQNLISTICVFCFVLIYYPK